MHFSTIILPVLASVAAAQSGTYYPTGTASGTGAYGNSTVAATGTGVSASTATPSSSSIDTSDAGAVHFTSGSAMGLFAAGGVAVLGAACLL